MQTLISDKRIEGIGNFQGQLEKNKEEREQLVGEGLVVGIYII